MTYYNDPDIDISGDGPIDVDLDGPDDGLNFGEDE